MISRSTVVGGLVVVELAIAGLAVGAVASPILAPPLFFGPPTAAVERTAAGQTLLDKSFAAGTSPRVVVDLPAIPVIVEAGTTPAVRVVETLVRRGWVTGTPSRLTAEQTPDGVRIHNLDVGELNAIFGDVEHTVRVTVPAGAHVELATGDNITASGLRAKLVAHTHDGRVRVSDHEGDLDVATESGRVELTDVHGGAIDAVSHDGRIYLTRVGAERLAVHSDSGRIIGNGVRAVDGGLTTADGRIEVSFTASSDATATVRTSDGHVRVSGFPTVGDGDDHSTVRLGSGRGHFEVTTESGHISITQGANG
jgi:putative adhesin